MSTEDPSPIEETFFLQHMNNPQIEVVHITIAPAVDLELVLGPRVSARMTKEATFRTNHELSIPRHRLIQPSFPA
jgi:hypothetical protein